MPFQFGRYSGLLLIFFVQGLVYAAILLRRGLRHDRRADLFLAAFLFLACLFISPWMLGFAGWYDGYNCLSCRNFLFYMPLQHSLWLGPLIYFYVRTVLYPQRGFTKKDWLHFVPGAIYLAWCAVVFVVDRIILRRYYLMNGEQDPDFDSWYIFVGLISLLIYGWLSIRLYNQYRKAVVQQASFADDVAYRWIRNFLFAYLIYFLFSLVFGGLSLVGANIGYTGDWWYYFFFGLIFCYMAINGHAHSVESTTGLRLPLVLEKHVALAEDEDEPSGTKQLKAPTDAERKQPVVPAPEIEAWKEKLYMAVVTNRLFSNPELTLADVAAAVGANTSIVSRTINSGFGQNFNDFINSYRVAEVQQKLEAGAGAQMTIMSLAYDAGFNSKPTFNRAFKKFTGKNPKDFLEGPSTA